MSRSRPGGPPAGERLLDLWRRCERLPFGRLMLICAAVLCLASVANARAALGLGAPVVEARHPRGEHDVLDEDAVGGAVRERRGLGLEPGASNSAAIAAQRSSGR